jgi:hypothetical protein
MHQACAELHSVVELLIERGIIDRATLHARQQLASEQIKRQLFERGMAVAMQEFGTSKYEFEGGAEIDCENRIPQCRASCCKLPFALSKQDVQEGVVRWDLGRPYLIAQEADHYCTHLNREGHACGIYAQRPIPCRGYDCRNDKRIWLDFEKRIINPQVQDPAFPANAETDMMSDEEEQDAA